MQTRSVNPLSAVKMERCFQKLSKGAHLVPVCLRPPSKRPNRGPGHPRKVLDGSSTSDSSNTAIASRSCALVTYNVVVAFSPTNGVQIL